MFLITTIIPEVPDLTCILDSDCLKKNYYGRKFQPHMLKFEDATLFSLCLPVINSECSQSILNMEKSGHRYVTQYFHLKVFGPTNINAELDSTLQ